MSRHSERLLPHCGCSEMNRGTGRHGLPAGKAALPIRDDGGVTGRHADLLGRNAELLGADLRERGLDALPHGHRAGIDGNASGPANAHNAGFERTAAGAFNAIADANAEVAALLARALLAC